MSYVDLDSDISKNTFDILSNDYSDKFRILYITKHRKFGILNRIEAHVPCETPFLYTYISDDDSEYLYENQRIGNKIMESKKDLRNYCYTPIYARPNTTVNYKYYYKIYSTNSSNKEPIVITKSLNNIWSVTDKIFQRYYMDIVFNSGLVKYDDCPDKIQIYKPIYMSSILNWTTSYPHKLYTANCKSVIAYRNISSTYNTDLNRYVLKFTVNGGIPSEKNSCFIEKDQTDDSKPSLELLRISKDIISVIYRSPFTFLHAFTYGVARAHSVNKYI